MSQCAHNKAINLAAEGTVSVTDISQIQNITIVGRPDFVNNNFKIALYAKETQRYLCFNDHWKLVGMKELQDTCYFNEAIVHGYFVFRSVVDLQRRIGFTQRGRAVGPKKTVNDACYMFTKIPTDQFFHQHIHFSAPKAKSTTTKIPKTEYTHAPYSTHVGRGSGRGRTKANRFNTHDDSVTHNQSGGGSGSGSGSGSGHGSGSGNGNKKFKKQRNGYKQRQQKQKQKQEMQQQVRGHSYNFNNPKNSTYLNSSRQNLVLSQHSINNHTNRKHNNSSNHPPHNHQVRHHHNDPNKVAKRQQHDQKQKTKMRQRVRPSPSSSTVATVTTTDPTRTSIAMAFLTTANAINSTKPHYTLTSSYTEINPTSVVPAITTVVTSDNHDTMRSTVVVTKRKGRRRKEEMLPKVSLRKKIETEENYASVGTEDYMTSSTDYGWMTNDILFSSIKPTSASLPSWETWYPSTSASYIDEDSAAAASVTEPNTDKKLSTSLKSFSVTDIAKNPSSVQTSVPLPTSFFSITLTENGIEDALSPTATTDLGMTTTTNTSTYTQTDFWSSSLNDNIDANMATISFEREAFSTYATPKLETNQNIFNSDEAIVEDITSLSTSNNAENSTAAMELPTTEDIGNDSDIFSSSTADGTTGIDSSTAEMTSSRDYDQTSEASATTTTTCTSNGSKSMTDCMLATKNTATVANNQKLKYGESTPTQHSTQNYKYSKMEAATKETTRSSLNTIPINNGKNTNFPETTSIMPTRSPKSSALPQPSNPVLTPATSLQYLKNIEKKANRFFSSDKTGIYPADLTTAFSSNVLSTKSSVLSPLTTRKSLRKSTQRLLATPFHQLTYVRNKAGDIDIDSIDNISIYPDLLDNDNDEPLVIPSTSRLTMISGYLPTSATATLPESIRIAKIKINRERKRILRLRNIGNYA